MPFTIHREKQSDKLIRMGHAPQPIEEIMLVKEFATADEILDAYNAATARSTPPVEQPKSKRGRPKMADKKLDHESGGPETIRKDDAGEQGAIGSRGENAPAQTKVPEGGEDVKIGNKEKE